MGSKRNNGLIMEKEYKKRCDDDDDVKNQSGCACGYRVNGTERTVGHEWCKKSNNETAAEMRQNMLVCARETDRQKNEQFHSSERKKKKVITTGHTSESDPVFASE